MTITQSLYNQISETRMTASALKQHPNNVIINNRSFLSFMCLGVYS